MPAECADLKLNVAKIYVLTFVVKHHVHFLQKPCEVAAPTKAEQHRKSDTHGRARPIDPSEVLHGGPLVHGNILTQ